MPPMDDHDDLSGFISQMTAAVTNVRLYEAGHPRAGHYFNTTFSTLQQLLRSKQEITLLLIGNDLVVNNHPLPADAPNFARFHRLLREKGVERLTFIWGLSENEFRVFVEDLAARDDQPLKSSRCIKLGKVALRVKGEALNEDDESQTPQVKENLAAMREVRDEKYDEVKSLYSDARHHKKIDIRGVDDMVKGFIQGFAHGINPLGIMASLKSSDEYTFTHVVNVCILTMSQAESLGFSGNQLYQIGVSSMLHDVGKLFIPDEIINKPGQLTKEERSIIENHAIQGARYILRLDHIPKLAVLGALEHHIKYDGTGYPLLHRGWKTNIVSQMIAISDVFDALRSRRVYSDPKPQDIILDILKKEKGVAFNPMLVDNFMKIVK